MAERWAGQLEGERHEGTTRARARQDRPSRKRLFSLVTELTRFVQTPSVSFQCSTLARSPASTSVVRRWAVTGERASEARRARPAGPPPMIVMSCSAGRAPTAADANVRREHVGRRLAS